MIKALAIIFPITLITSCSDSSQIRKEPVDIACTKVISAWKNYSKGWYGDYALAYGEYISNFSDFNPYKKKQLKKSDQIYEKYEKVLIASVDYWMGKTRKDLKEAGEIFKELSIKDGAFNQYTEDAFRIANNTETMFIKARRDGGESSEFVEDGKHITDLGKLLNFCGTDMVDPLALDP